MIRLVLADDDFFVREGVRRLLADQDGIEVVAACADAVELDAAVEETAPDVVLTDIRMPPTRTDEGIKAAQRFRTLHPQMGVVLLSQFVEPTYVKLLLKQGTEGRGYLLKERVADVGELVRATREVATGGSVLDPKVVEALIQVRSRRPGNALSRLTPRELEVLEAMAEGRNNAGIADLLVLSQRAVEKHINSMFTKLGLGEVRDTHPRVRAVLLYLAEGRSPG